MSNKSHSSTTLETSAGQRTTPDTTFSEQQLDNGNKRRKADHTDDGNDNDSERKKESRREANRVHAFKSRQRSKFMLQELQSSLHELSIDKTNLERENALLRAQVELLQQQYRSLLQNQQMLMLQPAQQQQQQSQATLQHQQHQQGSVVENQVYSGHDLPQNVVYPAADHGQHQHQQQPLPSLGTDALLRLTSQQQQAHTTFPSNLLTAGGMDVNLIGQFLQQQRNLQQQQQQQQQHLQTTSNESVGAPPPNSEPCEDVIAL
jgi:hypothetical protein